MKNKEKYTVLICDDSKDERFRFYERQFDNFNIFGVIKQDNTFIEINAIDSVEKLYKTILYLRSNNNLPDLILLDLFYKRPLPNIDEVEKDFIKDLLLLKKNFREIKEKANFYLEPSGVELLKRLRLTDEITTDELPISTYTDKNFNFLLSNDFNTIYELDPGFIYKDRDFDEPSSMISSSSEYFRILQMIERSKISKKNKKQKLSIFISHGRSKDWIEVQLFLEREMKRETIELAQQINDGNTIINKLDTTSNKCNYAVVIMTGDDVDPFGNPKVRENVMHEIGFFQGRYGLNNVCLIHEEGASIPSNLSGIVYLPYEKSNIKMIFSDLAKEIQNRNF